MRHEGTVVSKQCFQDSLFHSLCLGCQSAKVEQGAVKPEFHQLQSFINCSLTCANGQSCSIYFVFVFCLSPPVECVSSSWFCSRTFLGEPGLTDGSNVNLVSTKFPHDEGRPPFEPRRGIPVLEGTHVPRAENHLFC